VPENVVYDCRFHGERRRQQLAEMESALRAEQHRQLHMIPSAPTALNFNQRKTVPLISGFTGRFFLRDKAARCFCRGKQGPPIHSHSGKTNRSPTSNNL